MTATMYLPMYIDKHFFLYKIDYKNVRVQIYLKIKKKSG